MRLGIIGGHDREGVMPLLNYVIPRGGLKEVRILDMEIPSLLDTVSQLKVINDFTDIKIVKMEDLIIKDGEDIQVLVILTTSFDDLDEFATSVFFLVKTVFGIIEKSATDDLKIIFGDNYRGLIQHAMLQKLNSEKKLKLDITTISSIFQASNSLDSTENENKFRCYPKTDGSYYLYNPGDEMDNTAEERLMEELKEKISAIETVFKEGETGSSYSTVEGTAIARFLEVYLQNGWDTALRDQGLIGRLPSSKEADDYAIEPTIPIFLPPLEEMDEDDSDRLPELVDTHLKAASLFVGAVLKKIEN